MHATRLLHAACELRGNRETSPLNVIRLRRRRSLPAETGEDVRAALRASPPRPSTATRSRSSLVDTGGGRWRVAIHFRDPPDRSALRALAAAAAGAAAAKALRFERVEATDWVRDSLAGLAPVKAGRFIVHGGHDRAGIPPNRIGIEIEAALAFGTGHHGTTRGCLLALDRLCKALSERRPRRILDLGTGSGVLAIAAARALHRRVLATDIDVERGARRARQCAAQPRRRAWSSSCKLTAWRRRALRGRRRSIWCSPTSCSGRCCGWPRRSGRLTAPRRPHRPLRHRAGAGQRRDRGLSAVRARTALDLDGWTTLSSCGGRRRLGVAGRPAHRLPRMFEAQFPIVRRSRERGESAPRVAALRAELAHRGLDGFVVPARRPLSERIRAALRRAARLAHRLHRLRRPRHRACRPRGPLRRRPLSGAGARGSRQRDFFDRASGRAIRRRPGSKPICAPARSSAIRRGCTRSTAPSGSPRPAPRPAQALLPVDDNPIDAIWTDRPQPPLGAVVPHDLRYAGEDAEAQARARAHRDAESPQPTRCWSRTRTRCRWLFNIRGSDIPHTPVVLAFAIRAERRPAALFIDSRKLGNEVRS